MCDCKSVSTPAIPHRKQSKSDCPSEGSENSLEFFANRNNIVAYLETQSICPFLVALIFALLLFEIDNIPKLKVGPPAPRLFNDAKIWTHAS